MSDVDVQPVTFYVPASAREPIALNVAHSGLRMALVGRESLGLLADQWRVPGVYFLLGPTDDPDRFRAYVGEVGKGTLLGRLRTHGRKKEWWNRALLVASSSDEFNSAEIGWLEGRLYDVLNNAVAAEVMNGNRPGDLSLDARDRRVLERYVAPIMAALRACGASPDTADQKPAPTGRSSPTRYPEKVSDLIDAGLLKVGTLLRPTRVGLDASAEVLGNGELQIDGQAYSSLSGAATSITGRPEPGWDFWGAPSGAGGFVSLSQLRSRLRASRDGVGSEPVDEPTPSRKRSPKSARKQRRYSGTIVDLLREQLLRPGDRLTPTRRAIQATATVDADGTLLLNGERFVTPSAAAKAASGTQSEPGWSFWAVKREDGPVTLHELRLRLSQDQDT